MNEKTAGCMADFEPEDLKYILEPGRLLTWLESWYRDVRQTPFDALSLYDLSRALNQRLCVEQLVPIVIRVLQDNPMAGEWYEGDLLSSLQNAPVAYWRTHPDQRDAIKVISQDVLQHKDYKEHRDYMDKALAGLKKSFDASEA